MSYPSENRNNLSWFIDSPFILNISTTANVPVLEILVDRNFPFHCLQGKTPVSHPSAMIKRIVLLALLCMLAFPADSVDSRLRGLKVITTLSRET